jgi:hypothetical protein
MNALDISLTVLSAGLSVPSEEQLAAGADPVLEVALHVGIPLPFSQGPGQPPMIAPLAVVRYKMDRDAAVDFFGTAKEEAEKLPKPSQIQTASAADLANAAAVAKRLEDLKKGQ